MKFSFGSLDPSEPHEEEYVGKTPAERRRAEERWIGEGEEARDPEAERDELARVIFDAAGWLQRAEPGPLPEYRSNKARAALAKGIPLAKKALKPEETP